MVEAVGGDILKYLRDSIWPRDFYLVDVRGIGQAKVKSQVAL